MKKGNGNKTKSLTKIINEAPEKEVRDFLKDILKNDETLKQKFLLKISNNESSLNDYIKLVDHIIYHHEDDWGFFNYDEIDDFYNEIYDVSDDINDLIDKGRYIDAFKLSIYTYKSISLIDSEDDGEMDMLIKKFSSFFPIILSKVQPEDKSKILDISIEEYLTAKREFPNYYLEDFITKKFLEKCYQKRVIAFIDKKTEDFDCEPFELSHFLCVKADYLRDTKTPVEDIDKFCRENWNDMDLRQWLAKYYIGLNELNKAIDIYEECLNSDNIYRSYPLEYRTELLKLYRKTENSEKALETLWDLVCKSKCRDFYFELRDQYTHDEWIIKRENVFTYFPGDSKAPLLEEEGLYDRLWNILKDKNLYDIIRYEDVLKADYSDEILKRYNDYLNRSAKSTATRTIYREWVSLLKRMKKIKGGKKAAEDIVADWRIRYSNRKAMMDELNKF